MARTTLLLLSILFLLPVNASVKKLQVEYLTNPIGLDITVPPIQLAIGISRKRSETNSLSNYRSN